MMAWVEHEMETLNLGDPRRNHRVMEMLSIFSERPNESIPDACETWTQTKNSYRLLSNTHVMPTAIFSAHRDATLKRMANASMVLCVQDTTNIDLTSRRGLTGIGHLDTAWQRGLKLHSSLCVSTAGVPLGFVGQQMWTRSLDDLGKRSTRRARATVEKESQRWLTALAEAQENIPAEIRMLTVADREADIFALFAHPRRSGSDLLIRIGHNRKVAHQCEHLLEAIQAQAITGTHDVAVRRAQDRRARTATLTVRIGSFDVCAPRNGKRDESTVASVHVQVISAVEEHPPGNGSPIRWLLLTTLPVTGIDDAIQCLNWYAMRWLIERYHYVLKSGCHVEELQLETIEGFYRALTMYSIAAWRLLWTTHIARTDPDASCELVLENHEWQALHCAVHRTTTLPTKPPSIHEAVRLIARIGGFLARKGDGEPGVKVLWRGLQKLEALTLMYTVFKNTIQ